MASEVLEAPRSRKEKMTILGTRNKVRSKLMEFFLFNKFVRNFIFFQLQIKKVSFIILILGKFLILKANLWLIYGKKFEYMV